ncbi:MAG: hypothetical protein GY862_05855 [Gammaproteobacteria bacterium]|nr:hypothetical protein [Gammaproteobacteria bacterium]
MLVVLVLTGLISTLLMEGLTYVLHLRARFLEQLDDLQQGALQEHWFRGTSAALIPDYTDIPPSQANLFTGQEREFSGLTIAALDAETGLPAPFSWRLLYEGGKTVLQYRNSGGEYWDITHWYEQSGSFLYRAENGEWHKQWPPAFGLEVPQLPHAIMLSGWRRQEPVTWIVHIPGRKDPKPDYRHLGIF